MPTIVRPKDEKLKKGPRIEDRGSRNEESGCGPRKPRRTKAEMEAARAAEKDELIGNEVKDGDDETKA